MRAQLGEGYGTIVILILVIVVLAAVVGHLLSAAPIPLPSSVYSGATAENCNYFSSADPPGLYCTSDPYVTGTTSFANITNSSYYYSIDSFVGYGCGNYEPPCVDFQNAGASVYVAINYSGVAYSNAQDSAGISGANVLINQSQESETYAGQHGQCEEYPPPNPCVTESAYISALQNNQAILGAAIAYNNAIPAPPSTTSTSTTVTTTVTASQSTTTVSGSGSSTTTISQGSTSGSQSVGILQEIVDFFDGIGRWLSDLFNTKVKL